MPLPRVTIPNLVALRQTIWASVTEKFGWCWAPPLKKGGVSDPLETPTSPQVLPRQIWSFWVKRLVRKLRRSSGFHGHSRSLKPARIDRLPMTSCERSTVTTGLSRTASEIKGNVCKKISPPRVFSAPAEGLPLKFCNAGGL